MSVFDLALRALYTDPNISVDGLWRPQTSSEAYPVRLIRLSPQSEFDIAGMKISTDSIAFEIPFGFAPTIDEGDHIETGEGIYVVQAPPAKIMDGKIWRLDVKPS